MHLEIFVYLLCRFLGENRIHTVQRENSFTIRAPPRNWPLLVIENRSCKGWHGDSFPQADSGRQPCVTLRFEHVAAIFLWDFV